MCIERWVGCQMDWPIQEVNVSCYHFETDIWPPVLVAVYWCSGYHISLTPKRSSVRSRDRSDYYFAHSEKTDSTRAVERLFLDEKRHLIWYSMKQRHVDLRFVLSRWEDLTSIDSLSKYNTQINDPPDESTRSITKHSTRGIFFSLTLVRQSFWGGHQIQI